MSDHHPAPLVPAEVDLRDFATMPLAVQLLRDSRFVSEASPEAFRAGVLLWCAAWHQVPAGTLPDNDAELARLAGYGFVVKEWRKVKTQAMAKFVLCSDGRWHHQELAERALTAWSSRLEHYYERAKERLRKANKARSEEKPAQPPLPALTFDQWNQRRLAGGTPMEKAEAFTGIPPEEPPRSAGKTGGIPPENALKGEGTERIGNGEGEGKLLNASVPDGTGAKAPAGLSSGPAPTLVDTIFAVGLPMLQQAGVNDRNARTFLGHLRKVAKARGGDKAVVDALNRCADASALDPVTFLQGCFKARAPLSAEDQRQAANAAADAEAMQLLTGARQRPVETIDG
jgi:hypothetical protein